MQNLKMERNLNIATEEKYENGAKSENGNKMKKRMCGNLKMERDVNISTKTF